MPPKCFSDIDDEVLIPLDTLQAPTCTVRHVQGNRCTADAEAVGVGGGDVQRKERCSMHSLARTMVKNHICLRSIASTLVYCLHTISQRVAGLQLPSAAQSCRLAGLDFCLALL
jgi:hypothetical protein